MTKEKLIPQLRFKGFEGEWEKKKFRDLADIKRGASPRPIKDPKWFDSNSDIGWLRISDVTKQNGKVHYIEQRISKLGAEKTRVLNKPHLILSIAATIGEPAINYMKTGVHDGFLIFYNPQFELAFGFQWLRYFKSFWQQYGQPGSQVNLNSDIVNNQEVILPLKDEQQKIGAFFEKLDKLIELYQNKLHICEQYKTSLLKKIIPSDKNTLATIKFRQCDGNFNYEVLSNLVSIKTGNKNVEDNVPDGNYAFFDRSSEIKYLNTYDYDEEVIVYPGEGSRFFPRYYNGKYSLHQRAYGLYNFQNINSIYLYEVLCTKSDIFVRFSVGTTAKSLRRETFNHIDIPVPSLPEQQKIGQLFQKLDQEINLYEQKIEHLKQLKKGYLQKLFC